MWGREKVNNRSITVRVNGDQLDMLKEVYAESHFGQAEISDLIRSALEHYYDVLREAQIKRKAAEVTKNEEFQRQLEKEKKATVRKVKSRARK